MTVIIDGKTIARAIRKDALRRVKHLRQEGILPCLATILTGEDPAGVSYVAGKKKALAEAGMECRGMRLLAETSEAKLHD
jgi:methylenetetrahydrofolate dehydrogenase (NADP+)/methenyltetrahydrofolate cyclohydrolase